MDKEAKLNLTHLVRRATSPGTEETKGPGILLLHGRGADEADLMGLAAALDPRLTVVSPRAPFRLGPGFAWYGMSEVGKPDDTMNTSLTELRRFITGVLPAYNIAPDRLFLMGFSQGAVMSSAVALTMPEAIQGVVMHSGYIPVNSGLEFRVEEAVGKPFFVAHGIYDQVIPIKFGRQSYAYLTSIDARTTYQEYPIAHSISEESLYDFSEWLTRELDSQSGQGDQDQTA
ncbi:MAG: alpha/beta fold hydrolase [Chloroflexota bacterium]|nr:alpha/beta fold hydrolase [Chloroflexota bacterium]